MTDCTETMTFCSIAFYIEKCIYSFFSLTRRYSTNKSEYPLPFCLWEEMHMHRTNHRGAMGFSQVFSCSVFWTMRHDYFLSCLLFPLLAPFYFSFYTYVPGVVLITKEFLLTPK